MAPLLLLFCSDIKLLGSKVLVALKMRCVTEASMSSFTHQVAFHLFNCLVWDGKPELLLGDCKIEPQLSPCFEPMLVTPSSMKRAIDE